MKDHTCYYETGDGKAMLGISYRAAEKTGGLALQVLAEAVKDLPDIHPTGVTPEGDAVWLYGASPAPRPPVGQPARSRTDTPVTVDVGTLSRAFSEYGSHLLVLTGAGLSATAGIWCLKELRQVLSLESCRSVTHQVETNPERLIARFSVFVHQLYATAPTKAHRVLAQLHDRYGFALATSNRDLLHQKTGLRPIELEAISTIDLNKHAALLFVGAATDEFSLVPHFRSRGQPVYSVGLIPCEGTSHWVPGECDTVFTALEGSPSGLISTAQCCRSSSQT